MGFLRRQNAKPDYTALQIQTSTCILPIPIVWGQNRVAPNLIWYENFRAVQGSKGSTTGKGSVVSGAAASSASSYTYEADIMLALCEGPISGFGLVWKDLAIYTPSELGFGEESGTTPQAVWSYLEEYYPSQTLAYQGTAYVWAASYNLGDTASIGNHNFEIYGPLAGSGANGVDADPSLVIQDFLTNAQYGCGFNPASIDSQSLLTGGGSFQAYCRAMGYAFSPVLVSQEQASSILTRWLQLFTTAAVWSGGVLKFIPYGDTAISQGSEITYKTQLSVPIPVSPSSGVELPSFVQVASPVAFVSDGGVVYASSGIAFTFVGGIPNAAGEYSMAPAGTYIFGPADQGKPVVITYTAQSQGSYTPDLTPVYNLTDTDFIDESGNKDPVQVERVDVFSLPTIQRIEVSSRGNQYMAIPVEARDQSQIEIFGPRVGSTIEAHEICDEFVVGPLVAQAILQRELYVRTKFTFKLSWEYCLLDPMDIVTITDSNLGLSDYSVRVISIEEDDKGLLSLTCEELVAGVSNPAFYPNATSSGYQANTGVPAVAINAPLIVQPPTGVTGGVVQLWVGASGASGGNAQQWGGANVYVSLDNVTYSQIATVTAPLRQGFLTASIPAAAGWDSVDTLSVNLAESGGALTGTTQASAQQGATLSLVDSEFLAYETATLTGGNAYNLTGLARGLGGSTAAAHSTNAPFARLDSAVVQYDLPANLIGQTLYLKFQSYNIFGGGLEDLSTCQVYTYTTTAGTAGSGGATSGGTVTPSSDPILAQLLTGFPVDLGQVTAAPTVSDDFGAVSTAASGSVDLGAIAVTVTEALVALGINGAASVNLGLTTSYATVSGNLGSVNDAVDSASGASIDMGVV